MVPGSHLLEDRYAGSYDTRLGVRVLNKLRKIVGRSAFDEIERSGKAIDLPTRAGDLLIFDVRLDHRSTFDRRRFPGRPDPGEKFAIFNTFGCDDAFTSDYLAFMKQRPEPYYRFLHGSTFPEILYKKAAEFKIRILE